MNRKIDPSLVVGGKSLRTLIPDPEPVPLVFPSQPWRESSGHWPGSRPWYRAGRLLVRFGLGGHPAQWVTHGTSGTKAAQREALRDWQARIGHAAALAMRDDSQCWRNGPGPAIEAGPVEVWIDAVFAPGSKIPDRDNIQNGATDAMQGIIFINDNQVIGGECRRLLGPVEGITVEVWAVEPLTIA